MSNTSRSYTIVNVPDPKNLKADFVYNFFVSDERVNDAGDARVSGLDNKDLQNILNAGALTSVVPRYVNVSFNQINLPEDNSLLEILNNNSVKDICSEETVTNVGFAALRETDEKSTIRLKQKIDAVSKINGISFSDTNQSKKISEKLKVSHKDVQEILSPVKDPSTYIVNSIVPKNITPSIFEQASKAKLHAQVNMRLLSTAVNGADDASPLSNLETLRIAKKLSEDFLNIASPNSIFSTDVNPTIKSYGQPEKMDSSAKVGILNQAVVGYIVVRHCFLDDGTKRSRIFVLPGQKNTNYIDSEILYGATYTYEVRSLIKINAVLSGYIKNSGGALTDVESKWRVTFLVASRPSNAAKVRTEEYQPPNVPEGIFYKFNYSKMSGLMISWQMPSGRSRDVKYFQIFRRKSISDPFQCIAQIDFDDSLVRTILKESVNSERILRYSSPYNFYEDQDFTRDSSYIYAIAAVDAHGYTSGYSVQMHVTFEKLKNSLSLKVISRSGAPKSYPNFYVNPKTSDNIATDSFTQDAIYESRKKKMTVYFTPDALSALSSNGEKYEVIATSNSNPGYSFHFINLDLQKSATVDFLVKDLRNFKV